MSSPVPRAAARRTPAQPAGFDFTLHIRHLAADICDRLEELAHVDLSRVAVRFCQARKAVPYGIQASLTPLRFEQGQRTVVRRGRTWTIQRVYDDHGREMLYLLSFYLPRFLELPFQEKLATVVHELWHISPEFNGDLRRHPGRCFAHSHSQRQYDALMHQLTSKWLALNPPEELFGFLRYGFAELNRRQGPVFGQMIRTPKLIRAAAAESER